MQRAEHHTRVPDLLRLPPSASAQEWIGFPLALTSLFGREQDIADVAALVEDPDRRLITLLGPGGVGKTRLAIAVAEQAAPMFPHGAAFVPLAQLSQPDQIPHAVAAVLGVLTHPERTITQSVINSLHGRRFLLILDNLEHLMGEQTCQFIRTLLEACPRLTVLATSREPFRLSMEQRYPTLPLRTVTTAPDSPSPQMAALQLFIARAQAVRPDLACTPEDEVIIVEICKRLDGLPLAIELAAAWMRILHPAGLLARLEQRLPLLMDGPADSPARFRTMQAAIAWSYELLTPEQAAGLRRLSVFRGGFTLEAAAAVLQELDKPSEEAEHAALQLVGTLCDKSLLSPLDPIGSMQRFGMLEMVREYVQDRLAPGERRSAQRTHATFYRDLTERLEPILLGKDEAVWLRLYDAEMGNLRQALDWGLTYDPELSLRISGAMAWYWTWFHLAEGRSWLALALEATPDASPLFRARALTVATSIAALTGDTESLEKLTPVVVATAELADSWLARANAGWMQSILALYAGDFVGAYEYADQARSLMAPATSPTDVSLAAYIGSTCGDTAFLRGHRALGISHFEKALEQLGSTGGSCVPVIVFSNFAGWLVSLGMVQRAREVLQEAVEYASTSAMTWQSAITLVGLALADALEGKTVTAARRLGATEAIRVRADLLIPVHYKLRLDQATQLTRDDLGEVAFQREWERGRSDPSAFVATMREDAAALRDRRSAEMTRELGLTQREAQVLALVAAGQSDRDIAAKLFISVRTASKHVGSILVKMGVTSRAEAAVRAMHLGLA